MSPQRPPSAHPAPSPRAAASPDVTALVAARRLIAEGEPLAAYKALVHLASDAVPAPRLAAAITSAAIHAHAETPAAEVLERALANSDGPIRTALRRSLARLFRHGGALARSREQLVMLLAERPGDRRARATLNGLLVREARWEELDASLEREIKDALRADHRGRAARAWRQRAELFETRLAQPGHAAASYAQAAQLYDDVQDLRAAADARLRWTAALQALAAPPAEIAEAAAAALRSAERAGDLEGARTRLVQIGIPLPMKGRPAAPVRPPRRLSDPLPEGTTSEMVAGEALALDPRGPRPAARTEVMSAEDVQRELDRSARRRRLFGKDAALSQRTGEFEIPLRALSPPDFSRKEVDDFLEERGEAGEEHAQLFEHVRSHPLDPDGYHHLADYFDAHDDVERGDLMAEIATALEGVREAPLRVPRLILTAKDRAGLRHPGLRGDAGELLQLVGTALCAVFPATGRAAGSKQPFHLECGPGAQHAADALLSAVRILGVRAPDPFLSEDNGPPFSIVYAEGGPRLLVGRAAVKAALPPPELRFFSGRALFSQQPDLLALRNLGAEHLEQGLLLLEEALFGGRKISDGAWILRDQLPLKSLPRAKALFPGVKEVIDFDLLADAARHSANRAGLLVAGGIAPALSALRAKKALEPEMVELVRFAASERYLNLRKRRIDG